MVTDMLSAKFDWFENMSSEATKEEIETVKQDMENNLASIYAKLGEPC